jgi:L-2-hydroxycarboxylate dehydrogenase (NAD+)
MTTPTTPTGPAVPAVPVGSAAPAGPVVAVDDLRVFARRCLEAVGVDQDDAALTADVLVTADLRGISSHGCARLRRYVDGVASGRINARPVRQASTPAEAVVTVDADNGLGQPAAVLATHLAAEVAERVGVGVATVRRSNHVGIAGYYAGLAAERGLIGIVMTNASPQVAPTFGARPAYGTNPIAVSVPTAGPPFLLDMATSVVPRGRLERMARESRGMPEGWAIDPAGQPATDEDVVVTGLKARDGHALLPLGGAGDAFGGHKGFGLGLLVDILCGPLAGAAWGRRTYAAGTADLGQLVLVLDPGAFRDRGDFLDDVTSQLAEVRSTPTLPGHDRVLVAGDREHAAEAQHRATGISLAPPVWTDLAAIAARLGVELPGARFSEVGT